MQRAIAARGRLCQAAALAIVLWPQAIAGQGANPELKPTSVEAKTPDGLVVEVACRSGFDAVSVAENCRVVANRTAAIITKLSPLLGPFPAGRLKLSGDSHSLPGQIPASADILRSSAGDLYLPDLLPREVARQWLPYLDSRSSASDALLAEGLPEYLAWRSLRDAHPEVARALVAEALRDAVVAEPGLPAGASTGAAVGTTAEQIAARQRGLLVLRTLETVIDQERVDRVLPQVVRRYPGGRFSVADFEKVCEEIAGRDLSWFFRYFFVDRGIPEIELRRLPSESPGIVAGEIVVRGLPPEGSVRVGMTVHTAQGSVEHSVATRGAVTPFTVNVPAPALDITLDPDQRILRWTDAARRSQAQSQMLAELPSPIARKNVAEAIALYRRALAADPENASLRAQSLSERLGELEWAHDEWAAALEDLEAAVNGHSIAAYETYLTRGKAYLYHGVVSLHQSRPKDALEDARAGLALPLAVLQQLLPREPIESRGEMSLQQLLKILQDAATRY